MSDTPRRIWILDVDGTLLDLPVAIEEARGAIAACCREHRVEVLLTPLLPGLRRAAAILAGRDGAAAGAALLDAAYDLLEGAELAAAPRATPRAGAIALLRRIGVEPVALVSNNAAHPLEVALEHCGLRPRNLLALIGRTVGLPAKPDPAPILRALAGIVPPLGQVICVGDRPQDAEAARAAAGEIAGRSGEVLVCGIARDPARVAALVRAGAGLILPDLGALMERVFGGGGVHR